MRGVAEGDVDTVQLVDSAVTTAKIADSAVNSAKIASNQIAGCVGTSYNDTDGDCDDITEGGAAQIGHIQYSTITAAHLRNNSVIANKIATGVVNSDKITNGTITNDDLSAAVITFIDSQSTGGVGGGSLTDGGVATSHLADGAVTGAKIAANQITGCVSTAYNDTDGDCSDITVDEVTSTQIGHIQYSSITAAHLRNNSVIANKIADGAVNSAKITNDSITNEDLSAALKGEIGTQISGALGGGTESLTDGAVTTPKIADLAVTTGKIADSAVTTAKIADLAVTTGKLASAAVTGVKISFNQIGGCAGSTDYNDTDGDCNDITVAEETSTLIGHIQYNTITAAHLRANSVSSAKIVNGTITNDDLSAAVLTFITSQSGGGGGSGTPLTDGSVTTAHLADSAVATAKVADEAVTGLKIANGTITNDDLSDAVKTFISEQSGGQALTTNSVTSDHIADAAVGRAQVSQEIRDYLDSIAALSSATTMTSTAASTTLNTAVDATSVSTEDQTLVNMLRDQFANGIPLAEALNMATAAQRTRYQGLSEPLKLAVDAALAPSMWAQQELGLRTDRLRVGTATLTQAQVQTTAVSQQNFQAGNLRSQTNYLAERIGLNPRPEANVNGNLSERVAYAIERAEAGGNMSAEISRLDSAIALSGALVTPTVDAGKTVGLRLSFAGYDSNNAFSGGVAFSLSRFINIPVFVGASYAVSGSESLFKVDLGVSF